MKRNSLRKLPKKKEREKNRRKKLNKFQEEEDEDTKESFIATSAEELTSKLSGKLTNVKKGGL